MSTFRSSVDRRTGRRGVKKASVFKENQVLISTESKAKAHRRKKPDKSDRHVAIESPEFQMLVKLYVPANLLIKNNKVSMKSLTSYLPALVSSDRDRFPELNFELHIFLSSLVTAYVSSWYLGKLNTENVAFIHEVYETLCTFVRDISSRISGIVESTRLLALANEVAEILDGHLRDNAVENGVPKYASIMRERSSHSILEHATTNDLRRQYLAKSHISFDEKWMSLSGDKRNTEPSIKGNKPSQVYLQVLVRGILRATFDKAAESQNPRSSVIVENFLTVLLGDLVLGKLVAKLSEPEFLISTVMGNISSKLNRDSQNGEKEAEISRPSKDEIEQSFNSQCFSSLQKAKDVFHSIAINISSASAALRQHMHSSGDTPNILYSPVLSLIDTVTNISSRKPIVVSFLSLVRSAAFSFQSLAPQIENYIGAFIIEKIARSPVADDGTLAHMVESLRNSLFGKTKESTPKEESATIHQVRDEIYAMLDGRLSSSSPLSISAMWFAYEDEDENSLKAKIEAFLTIFNQDGSEDGEESGIIRRESDMNRLLVMKILDCIMQNLYPEMTMSLDDTKK